MKTIWMLSLKCKPRKRQIWCIMLRDIERTVLYLRSGNCSACKKQITIFIFDGNIMTGCLICMSIKCQNFLSGVFIFWYPIISYKLCAIMIYTSIWLMVSVTSTDVCSQAKKCWFLSLLRYILSFLFCPSGFYGETLIWGHRNKGRLGTCRSRVYV